MNALDALVNANSSGLNTLDGGGTQAATSGVKTPPSKTPTTFGLSAYPLGNSPASQIYSNEVSAAELASLVHRALEGSSEALQAITEKAALGDPAAEKAMQTVKSARGGGGGGGGGGAPKQPSQGKSAGGGGATKMGPRGPALDTSFDARNRDGSLKDPTGFANHEKGNASPLSGFDSASSSSSSKAGTSDLTKIGQGQTPSQDFWDKANQETPNSQDNSNPEAVDSPDKRPGAYKGPDGQWHVPEDGKGKTTQTRFFKGIGFREVEVA